MGTNTSTRLLLMTLMTSFASTTVVTSASGVTTVFTPPNGQGLAWWQTGIVYQIYPRSFKDTDGDGIGDLQGVIDKLDYLEGLGIESIWLSPFFKSPMNDMGYDISDYVTVDPLFGNVSVFDRLVTKAHAKGLKIIIDLVPGHTSTQHAWFEKSVRREDPYTDYYTWSDGKMEGGIRKPPNNWLSVFGGSAWTWNNERQQFYYHAFLDTQANLNFKNEKVKDEMKNVIRFWLDHGVDGLRVDAISHIYHVDDLSLDEPPAGNNLSDFNYNSQQHIYQENRPEIYPIIKSWVQILKEYEQKDAHQRYMILETYTGADVRTKMFNTGANPFNFDLTWFSQPITGFEVRDKIVYAYKNLPSGKWPNFVLGNHDVRRVSEKFGPDHVDVFNMLLLTLWGTPTTYYGEEIGMRPPVITWNQTVDPWGINYGEDRYQEFTRDYQRSPMQWDDTPLAGFTDGPTTWLPVAKTYTSINVKAEEGGMAPSHLKLYKRLARLRQEPAFKEGRIRMGVATQNVVAYVREEIPNRFLVALNVGESREINNMEFEVRAVWGSVIAVTSYSDKVIGSAVSTKNLTLNPGEGAVLLLPPTDDPIVGK